MSGFTPGPWRVRKDCKFTRLAEVVKSDGTAFEEGYFLSNPEDMANAHLIAAAPDLYAAIKDALPDICGCEDSVDQGPQLCVFHAAIDKAEGRS